MDDANTSTVPVTAKNEGHVELDANGVFVCVECENEVKPHLNGENGPEEVNVVLVTQELKTTPGKKIVAFCPTCGMEYALELDTSGKLVLLPSDEEK